MKTSLQKRCPWGSPKQWKEVVEQSGEYECVNGQKKEPSSAHYIPMGGLAMVNAKGTNLVCNTT